VRQRPIKPNKALHLTANSVAVLQGFVPHQSLVVFSKFGSILLAAGELLR